MAVDLSQSVYSKSGCTIDTDGKTILETSDFAQHYAWQSIVASSSPSLGTDAVVWVDAKAGTRDNFWVGGRQNNATYMATFDIAAGTVTETGGDVTATIALAPGAVDVYRCKITFNATLPTDTVDLSFGPSGGTTNADREYTGTLNAAACTVEGVHINVGTVDQGTFKTTTRQTVANLVGDAVALNVGATQSEATDDPGTLLAFDSFDFDGTNDTLERAAPSYTRHAISAAICVRHDGTQAGEKHLMGQWSTAAKTWRIAFDATASQWFVELSEDGSTVAKKYLVDTALTADTWYALGFTWNGVDEVLTLLQDGSALAASAITESPDASFQELNLSTVDHTFGSDGDGANSFSGDLARPMFGDGILTDATFQTHADNCPDGTTSGGGGGSGTTDFFTTESQLLDWLDTNHGVTSANVFYVDNRVGQGGSDANDGKLTGTGAWATIQHASDTLTAGQAVIIRGTTAVNNRYEEEVWLGGSGTSTSARIWYCGSPENPPIIDGSTPFVETWASEGDGVYSAPYTERRPYVESNAYTTNCGASTTCVHESTWMSHQIIHNDVQLKRLHAATQPATSSFNEGECWFQPGTGSGDAAYETPQKVYVKLPASADPSSETMRIGRDTRYLFDYSTTAASTGNYSTEAGYPGGAAADRNQGRDFIGVVNLHTRFGCSIRKHGLFNVRGQGWYVWHSSASECAGLGMNYFGDTHEIYDCLTHRNGAGGGYWQHLEGCTIDLYRCVENNIHYFPPSWLAAGVKCEESGQVSLNTVSRMLTKDNLGVGFWFDVDNGVGNGAGQAFLMDRCMAVRNNRGNFMDERRSRYIEWRDCVSFDSTEDSEGAAGNTIAPGFRSQASKINIYTRCVSVFNDGKGLLYKTTDPPGNEDVFDTCTFVGNMQSGNVIDSGKTEFQGGDITGGSDWDTSTITDLLVANDLSGLSGSKGLFHDSTAGSYTDSAATFEGWNVATGTVVVTNPADVIPDYTDEYKCWVMAPSYASRQPVGFVHPETLQNWFGPNASV